MKKQKELNFFSLLLLERAVLYLESNMTSINALLSAYFIIINIMLLLYDRCYSQFFIYINIFSSYYKLQDFINEGTAARHAQITRISSCRVGFNLRPSVLSLCSQSLVILPLVFFYVLFIWYFYLYFPRSISNLFIIYIFM